MGWKNGSYELRAIYVLPAPEKTENTKTAGIDIGEIHIAMAHDGEDCILLNGRELRSTKRYQNKLKGKLAAKLSHHKRGSRRYNNLKRSKRKQLAKLDHQVKDRLHKGTTKLIQTLHERGVGRVVIGDVKGIRKDLDCGAKTNQKLHQWSHGKTRFYLTYKAEMRGMSVSLQEESYTSQECPSCGARLKTKTRDYHCKDCGYRCHRDAVGSWNIRKKYLGLLGTPPGIPVVGSMAFPESLKWKRSAFVAQDR